MKFLKDVIEVERLLKLDRNQVMSFKVCVVEPVVVKEHFYKDNEGKMHLDKCSMDDKCPYCITQKTLMKTGASIEEIRKFYPRARYHLPIFVEDNPYEIEAGEYVFRFGKQIRDAYMQLLTDADRYKFNPTKGLGFTHVVTDKHSYNDYETSFFTFGDKKKWTVLKVGKLCADAANIRI
jgi:hypothetical protein